jgi:hypothetical protein
MIAQLYYVNIDTKAQELLSREERAEVSDGKLWYSWFHKENEIVRTMEIP